MASVLIRLRSKGTNLVSTPVWTNIRVCSLPNLSTHTQQHPERVTSLKAYDDIPCSSNSRFRAVLSAFSSVRNATQFTDNAHKKLGPIFRSPILGEKCISVANTDAIECILRAEGKYPQRMPLPSFKQQRIDIGEDLGVFFAEGEQWYKLRKYANKIFLNPQRIGAYLPLVNEVTVDFMDFLRHLRDQNNVVSLNEEVSKWTFESVGYVMFEKRFDTLAENPPRESQEFIQGMRRIVEMNSFFILLPRKFVNVFMRKKYQEALDIQRNAFNLARKQIDEKFKSLDKNTDLDDKTGLLSDVVRQAMQSKEDERPRESELYATLFELLAAGVDTTANAALFSLYELSRHPEIQERVYQEIKAVAPNGEAPTPQMLQETRLLRSCVKEALRLYPVASSLTRILHEDTVIMDYRIPANTHVIMSLHTLSRDENFYERPEEFLPERWLRDPDGGRKQKHNPFTSLPFGFGVRMCIGRRFAELELYTLIFNVLQQFKLEYALPDPMKTTTRMVLAPAHDIKVKLIDRK